MHKIHLRPDRTRRAVDAALPSGSPEESLPREAESAEETALQAAERHERLVMETLADGVTVFEPGADGTWRMVWANEASLTFLGRPADEVVGKRADEYLPPDVVAGMEYLRLRAIESGEPQEHEAVGVIDGHPYRRIVRVTPVFDAAGVCVQVIWRTTDVSEQRRSELRFRAAAEANGDAFMIVEPILAEDGSIRDFAITFANQAAREGALSSGGPHEGTALSGLFPDLPQAFAVANEEYAAVVRTGAATREEKHLSRATGNERWFERQINPFGEGLVVTYRDITASKRTQLALEAAERDQRAILENLTDGIVVTDLHEDGQFRISYFREVPAIEGSEDPRSALGKSWDELFDPERAAERIAYSREAIASGTSVDFEAAVENVAGDTIRLLGRATPVFDDEGTCRRVIWRHADVTPQYEARRAIEESERNLRDRLAAEQEAREVNDRFRLIAENATDGIVSITEAGRIVFANRAVAAIFGYSASELLALPVTGLMPELFRPRHERAFHTYVTTRERTLNWKSFELTGRRKDGSEFPFEASLSDGLHDGEPVVTAFIRDVTERRRTEEALMQAQKLESLSVLAGGIAHDFNNMLVAIMGNAGLAMMELPPNSPVRQTLAEIEVGAQRAAELARQMLAYAGKGRLSIQAVDLTLLVEEIPHLLRTSIGKGIRLVFDLSPDLPPVEGDPTQLRQVVMNLVLNASDAIGISDGLIQVSTGITVVDGAFGQAGYLPGEPPPGTYAYLDVRDSGCGMAPATLARIFDPFFTTKFTGRGLGLAATLGIVRAHSGALKVESVPAEGTAFRILLPAAASSLTPAPAPSVPSLSWRGSGTVLVVDDEESIRKVAARALATMGFETVLAVDGQDGLEKLRHSETPIAAVLMDLTMPRLDGEAATKAMHALRPDLPIVLMTGFDEGEMSERFSASGCAGFVPKPFTLNQLREAMQAAIPNRSASRASGSSVPT